MLIKEHNSLALHLALVGGRDRTKQEVGVEQTVHTLVPRIEAQSFNNRICMYFVLFVFFCMYVAHAIR